jgi:hypothetical protein
MVLLIKRHACCCVYDQFDRYTVATNILYYVGLNGNKERVLRVCIT